MVSKKPKKVKRKPRRKKTKRELVPEEPRKLLLVDGKPIYELGGFISLDKFHIWKDNYTSARGNKRVDRYGDTIKCHTFGKGNLLNLISQPDCHAVRIYYGTAEERDGTKSPKLMLVGVYKDGKDMTEHTLVLDDSYPCPDICDDDDNT